MEIRQLGAEDGPAVLQAGSLFDEPPDPESVRAYLRDDRNLFLIAYDGDAPIGFLRGTGLGQLKSPRRQMFLYEVAVDEAHRRRGVGRALVDFLLRYCRERHFEEVFVFTDDPENAAAEHLYRSAGGATETRGDRMYVFRLD